MATSSDYVFTAELDDVKVLKSLQAIDIAVTKLAKKIDKTWKTVDRTLERSSRTRLSAEQKLRVEVQRTARTKINLARQESRTQQEAIRLAAKQVLSEDEIQRTIRSRLATRRAELALQRKQAGAGGGGGTVAAKAGGIGVGSALGIGAGVGTVVVAINKIVNGLERMANLLVKVSSEAVTVSLNVESVEKSFQGVFGSADLAAAAMSRVKEEAARIGVPVDELSLLTRRLIPQVESLDQALEFGELAQLLTLLDPEQGPQGAIISITEALAGDLQSLRRRFELPTEGIIDLQNELGAVEGLLVGLGDELAARGLDFETMSRTSIFAFNRVRANITLLQDELGDPIRQSLTELANAFNDFFEENRDDINAIVTLFGELLGTLVELAGFGGLDLLEAEDLERVQEILARIVAGLDLTAEAFGNIGDIDTSGSIDQIDRLSASIDKLFINIIKLKGFFEAIDEIQRTTRIGVFTSAPPLADIGKYPEVDAAYNKAVKNALDPTADFPTIEEAWAKAMADTDQAVQDYKDNIEGLTEAKLEDALATDAATAAELRAINAKLALTQATKDRANAEEDRDTARENLAEKEKAFYDELSELSEDYANQQADAQTAYGRKILDIEETTAEKRVDAATKNARKIQDVYEKNQDKLEDIALGFDRKVSDILRKAGQKEAEIAIANAKKRLEIEEYFLERLAEIRRKFDFDAEEAVRQNDAVALLRIRRRMEFELEEERIGRDEKIVDEDKSAEERIEALRRTTDQELEIARIGQERKIQDQRIALQRQLEAQRNNLARELADISLNEQRKREEAKKSLDRQLEDLETTFERRKEKINEKYAEEIEALRENLAKAVQAVKEANQAMADAVNAGGDMMIKALSKQNAQISALMSKRAALLARAQSRYKFRTATGVEGRLPGLGGTAIDRGKRTSGRETGGRVLGGLDYLIGENGPELMRFASNGFISPNQATYRPGANGGGSSVDNSRTANVDLSMLDPAGLSPQQLAIVRNVVSGMMLEVMR